jgi:hypothetical protein
MPPAPNTTSEFPTTSVRPHINWLLRDPLQTFLDRLGSINATESSKYNTNKGALTKAAFEGLKSCISENYNLAKAKLASEKLLGENGNKSIIDFLERILTKADEVLKKINNIQNAKQAILDPKAPKGDIAGRVAEMLNDIQNMENDIIGKIKEKLQKKHKIDPNKKTPSTAKTPKPEQVKKGFGGNPKGKKSKPSEFTIAASQFHFSKERGIVEARDYVLKLEAVMKFNFTMRNEKYAEYRLHPSPALFKLIAGYDKAIQAQQAEANNVYWGRDAIQQLTRNNMPVNEQTIAKAFNKAIDNNLIRGTNNQPLQAVSIKQDELYKSFQNKSTNQHDLISKLGLTGVSVSLMLFFKAIVELGTNQQSSPRLSF